MAISKKYILLGSVITLFVVALIVALRVLLYGTLVVVIDDTHDPLTTEVKLGDTRLFPTGENGTRYVFSGRTGNYKLSITSPLTVAVEKEAVVTKDSTEVSTSLETVSVGTIAINTLPPLEGYRVEESRLYGPDKNWVIVKAQSSNTDIRPAFYVLRYIENEWVVVESGEKLNSAEDQYTDAPEELLEYIDTEAGD
jgi:hypothetical protein